MGTDWTEVDIVDGKGNVLVTVLKPVNWLFTKWKQFLSRLLRMDAHQYAALHEKLASCVAETQSARAMGAVLEEQINLQRIRWKREAGEARAAIMIAMQELGADATIEDEATA